MSRNVLITGCSSGIGLCAAQGLKQRGYKVFASARKEEDVRRLRDLGLTCLRLDLDDSTSIQDAFEEMMLRTGGKIYALFNNGAYGQPGAVEDLTRDVLRAQLETNLLGWHELTRLVIPVMRIQGKGRIIQNSSILGFAAMPYRGAYNCSKYALEGLTDTLRLELLGSGIHVSLIEPGPIQSHFRQNAFLKFKENIDAEQSKHRQQYGAMEARLNKEGTAAPFTLPPEAVLKKLIHALESPRPRARYPVTVPTHLFAVLKRLLPTRALDHLLRLASGDGAR
ncbi:MAG: short-chain dehydrogenase [Gammaproteobacteria bacterium RIFOXYA12_FULL_61_12]|nr:MAG: short-chain dehydrogenase [Gammaproteobacteria bacterium RIFOXYD12_FULL_61_37]OGT92407.1 MAG: short-chain dehydrogenase [Gammaproteobacteria bacterium RIFOXYA12_FULL_61_12]